METISIDKELLAFKDHLNFNERTIFSAKFGDGKTFFLNEFKKKYSDKIKGDDTLKEKYYFITLYPVNYCIAENQDIFEYIKRDILYHLAKDDKLNPIDFEGIAKSIFTWENLKDVLSFLVSCMPQGEILKKIIDKGERFAKKYEENKTTFQKYDSWFTSQKGGLYEHDGYTELITATLKYIKESGYKTVLIIEDLDRIDPAHLFRILNILGAHIDEHLYNESDNKNKFGFDNIITVFDYNTTENIFHHFYGKNANYKGYINKFTSHQPFFYSIDEVAREYLYQLILEKCCISSENIRKMDLQINNKLDLLSVRDVKNILNGVDSYIDEKIFQLASFEINTKSPLTYTIAILKLLGIQDTKAIKKYILNLPTIDLLNCVNVFLLVLSKTRLGSFKYRGGPYIFKKSIDFNQVINKIEILEGGLYTLPSNLNDEDLQKCFDEALNYIKK